MQPGLTWYAQPIAYCPDQAFRYRGRTPAGRRCQPARRPGYRRLAPRRVLRAYSTDRRPCRCATAARTLAADWGTHWRRPQPFGHLQPAGCPTCGGDLHVGDDSARCLACGYLCFVDYDEL